MGKIGPKRMKNHAIFHDVFGRFYRKYGRGRGYSYIFICGNTWMKSSRFIEHLTGTFHWFFHKEVVR